MISMECPKCGRRGRVPPDKINARLHCKKCEAIFHLDPTGKVILGEPGSKGGGGTSEKAAKPAKSREAVAKPEFDPIEAWEKIPKSTKLGVPIGLIVLLGLVLRSGAGGGLDTSHEDRARAIAMALATNDRSRVVGAATSDTAEAAGKWFDLVRAQLEKAKLGPSATATVTLFAGDPSKDDSVILSAGVGDTITNPKNPTIETFAIHLQRSGRRWWLNGQQSLADAERLAAAAAAAAAGSGSGSATASPGASRKGR